MNWEAIGAIGEVIGAVAVVVTLVYLAAQIRHNTMSNRNAALQTISAQNADWLSLITQDDDVARIFRAGQKDLGSITGNDLVRYGMLMTQFCRVFGAQHHQHINRALPDDIWQSSERSIQFTLQRRGARNWWSSFGYQFSESFQQLVNGLLSESSDD
jgi:hypothetical protein